jgi:hypothetical protein
VLEAFAAAADSSTVREELPRMRTVPKARGKRVTWYKVRLPKWAEDPEGIGTTPEEIAALADLVEEARLAQAAQRQAANAARGATMRFTRALENMSTAGASVILKIRAKAGMDGDGIYAKASVDVPRKQSPVAAPGKPGGFKFVLEWGGWLTLRWTCPNPKNATGTIYHVRRQLDRKGEFVFLGTAGKKRFVDKTLPAGVAVATYRVQAVRSTRTGPQGETIIEFGGAPQMPETATRAAA